MLAQMAVDEIRQDLFGRQADFGLQNLSLLEKNYDASFPSSYLHQVLLSRISPLWYEVSVLSVVVHRATLLVIDLDQRKEMLRTMNALPTIKTASLFQGVSPAGLERLASSARLRTYGPGDAIVSETAPVRSFYVVLTGQVKLYKSSADGKEQTLYLLGPGEPFGLCTALAVESFPANATALQESVLLILPGPDVELVAMKEPVLLLNVVQVLSRRLKESMSLVESLALFEIPQRLAAFLLHDITRNAKTARRRVVLPTTHRELAKIIGATPEALSRALKKLAAEGILAVQGRVISILDHNGLKEIAEEGRRHTPP